jgi:hypothetical protein
MSRSLRIVQAGDGDGSDISMSEAIAALAGRIVADKPTVVLMIWESPGKARLDSVSVVMAAIPDSRAVIRGLVDDAYELLHPSGDQTEE